MCKKPPLLTTERLIICFPRPADAPDWRRMDEDPDVNLFMRAGRALRTETESVELFSKCVLHGEKHGFTLGSVFERSTGAFVGRGGLIHQALDDDDPTIEIGYHFLPAYWGLGYATEITKACINHARHALQLTHIIGVTHPEHAKSQAVLQKAGLQLVGDTTYCDQSVTLYRLDLTSDIHPRY